MKNSYAPKYTVRKAKWNPQNKIFANHIFAAGLVSKIHKEPLYFNNKKENNPGKIRADDQNIPNKIYKWPNPASLIIRNKNQNQKEILFHIQYND